VSTRASDGRKGQQQAKGKGSRQNAKEINVLVRQRRRVGDTLAGSAVRMAGSIRNVPLCMAVEEVDDKLQDASRQ
jgi:N-acetylglucosamine-6-phosphate deacetylase